MTFHDLAAAGRPIAALMFGFAVLVATLGPAGAGEVRLGNNVRIGGHDFSNQTFDSKHRARIHLYDRKPPKEGFVWRSDGRGGHVKICHLQRK